MLWYSEINLLKGKKKMKRMMNLIVLITIGLGFSGCGRTSHPGIPIQTILYHDINKPVGIKILRVPEFNKINVAEVGENLYSKSNQNLQNTFDHQVNDV